MSKVTNVQEAIALIADSSTVAIQGSGEGSATQLYCSRRWERNSLQAGNPRNSHFFTPSARELFKGAVVNLGFGVPSYVSAVASEQGMLGDITFTVEQGIVGGMPAGR